MNVIIRLQNLPWSANASDIRQFFKGLQIPEGGVHIVGGDFGDAFIAFSSDEDARQAMSLNGGKIKDAKVMLLLSSRAEMQKVIEKARAASAFMTSKMVQQLPSAEAFTNQFVNKKVPETTNSKTAQPQSVMTNYMQHSAPVAPIINFQMKTNDSALNQATAPAPNAQLPLYYAMNNTQDYIKYMSMTNATGNYQIDSNKLRDLYNKDKKIDNFQMAQSQHQSNSAYNRHVSPSRERHRSRSPMSSRYDDKKERKRRTRFSSPEKAAAALNAAANPLYQAQNPLIQMQQSNPLAQLQQHNPLTVLQQQLPQPILNANALNNMMTSSNSNNVPNTKMPNNIWDVPPQNLNSYSSYNTSNNNSNNIIPNNYSIANNSQYQPTNSYNSTNSLGNLEIGTCIKVSNIDKETGYGDVRKFFGGLPIGNNDIKFLKDDDGDPTGIALIRFLSSDSKKQAMTKNGWQLNSTQIILTSISENDFENGSRGRGDNRDKSYKRSYDDSRRDNDRFRDRSNSRERSYERGGRDKDYHNTNRNMSNAFNSRNNYQNNNRYNDRYERERGSNYEGNRNNFNQNNYNRRDVRRENNGRNRNFRDNSEQEDKIEYIPDENFTVLVIDDIPDKNEADLFESFPDILGISIDKYTAYCKFRTHEAAKAVLENRFLHYIRNKRVFVEKGSELQYDDYVKKCGKIDNPEFEDESRNGNSNEAREESQNEEDGFKKSEDEQKKSNYESRDPRQKVQCDRPPSSSSQGSNNPQQNIVIKTDCVLIKNLDSTTTIEDIEKFFADVNIQRNQMRTHILLDKRGQPCGDCFVEFKFENDLQKAITKNNQELGENCVQVLPIPREQVEAVLSSFGDDNNRQSQNRGPSNRDWAPPNDFGNPGCVVMISNLCYRASIDDILDEFREFDLKPDQIIRRYNDVGQPTGNACINFNSPDDASKACDDYNKIRIMNRTVWLRRF